MSIEAYEDFDSFDDEEEKEHKEEIEHKYTEKINFFVKKYEESKAQKVQELGYNDIDELHAEAKELKEVVSFTPNAFTQFWLLALRNYRDTVRIPDAGITRIFGFCMMTIIMLLAYGQLGMDEQSIQSRNGLLFMVWVMNFFITMQNIIVLFPDEKPVFVREQISETYSPTVYFFSKVMSETPILLISCTFLWLVLYFGWQLSTENASYFFIFYFLSILIVMWAEGMGLFIGAIAPNKSIALDLGPGSLILLVLLSGYFVSQGNPIPITEPFKYISIFKWTFQVYLLNEYDGITLDWEPDWDPLSQYGFSETIDESAIASVVLTILTFLLAYVTLLIQAYRAK